MDLQEARRVAKAAAQGREGYEVVLTTHCKERMLERNVSRPWIDNVLKAGRVVEGPFWSDEHEDWECAFEGKAGEGLKVVVGIEVTDSGSYVIVVTVIPLD